jgi:hypothetical protein
MILAGALRGPALAQPGLGLIQPDAGTVFGIEWRKIVDSPAGGWLSGQMKKYLWGTEKMLDAAMHGLDSVVIAMPASGPAQGNTNPPILAVMSGHFEVDELRSLAKMELTNSEMYRAVELLSPPNDSTENYRLAFIDETTILMGDNAAVRAAIDRLKNEHLTAPVKGGILAGIADLSSRNAVWMTGEFPESALKTTSPMAAQMSAGVKGVELGISFERGLRLLLNIRTISSDTAAAFAPLLQGLIAMGAMSQSDSPQTGELIKKIQVKSDNTRVTLGLVLDKDELNWMIEKLIAWEQSQ